MFGNGPSPEFPNSNSSNSAITSPQTRRYNCIAWAAGDDANWWWPDDGYSYWPPGVTREETLESFILAYGTLGYVLCGDGSLEAGFEKIALYVKRGLLGVEPTHAARQLNDGKWTSKLGTWEDIEHLTPSVLDGPAYGTAVVYLRRPIKVQ